MSSQYFLTPSFPSTKNQKKKMFCMLPSCLLHIVGLYLKNDLPRWCYKACEKDDVDLLKMLLSMFVADHTQLCKWKLFQKALHNQRKKIALFLIDEYVIQGKQITREDPLFCVLKTGQVDIPRFIPPWKQQTQSYWSTLFGIVSKQKTDNAFQYVACRYPDFLHYCAQFALCNKRRFLEFFKQTYSEIAFHYCIENKVFETITMHEMEHLIRTFIPILYFRQIYTIRFGLKFEFALFWVAMRMEDLDALNFFVTLPDFHVPECCIPDITRNCNNCEFVDWLLQQNPTPFYVLLSSSFLWSDLLTSTDGTMRANTNCVVCWLLENFFFSQFICVNLWWKLCVDNHILCFKKKTIIRKPHKKKGQSRGKKPMNILTTFRSKFRIQYASDLHLELCRHPIEFEQLIRPCAPFLALAGDIGQPNKKIFDAFMQYCANNWARVFYVAGNHEFYVDRFLYDDDVKFTDTMSAKQDEISIVVQKYRNIHFFTEQTPSVYLEEEKVAIVGQTLWTEIATTKHETARKSLNDYNFIAVSTENVTQRRILPHDVNALHQKQRQILTTELLLWNERGIPVCVITHHMPSFELIAECYQNNPINFCFASHCDNLIAAPVKAWIYGHSHACNKQIINGVICAINAKGYPREHTGFKDEAFLEFC